MANQAAWFHEKGGSFTVGDAPMPEPAANEVIIRSHSIAFNPADVAVWRMGLFVEKYPATVGCDVAGVITALGSSVSSFEIGDRVCATPNWASKSDKRNKGSGQLYCAALAGLTAKLPDNIGFTDGCVLPIALTTAGASLYQESNLALPLPPACDPGSRPNIGTLLVWGGSSSVGSCAIQLASAAGCEVAATCGEHNFDFCRQLGASHVFDYNSPSVVEDIVHALKRKDFVGVYAAVLKAENVNEVLPKSAQIAHELGGSLGKRVATVLPPLPAAMSLVPTGLPRDVTISYCWSTSIADDAVGPALFGKWVTAALADGRLKCMPKAQVVGRGLESVQAGVEAMEKGVSATKLVVELV